ncbi:hypothetical protein BDW68DRAFT_192634 [Aspergillus falconensis]
MESFRAMMITHAFTFFFGLSISKGQMIPEIITFILNTLSLLHSHISRYFSPENHRAAKAAKILDQLTVKLLDRYEVEETYSVGTWQRQAYEDFTRALVAKDKIFPCIYGTKGYKSNELDFIFLDSEDLDDLNIAKVAAKSIVEYHKVLQSRGRNISLVLMCPPPSPTAQRTVEEYHKLFWSFLKRLRQLDPKPWPTKIPHNTFDRKWCMNFDGLEAFFAVLTSPRVVFDIIFKDACYRESATKTVWGLVDKYDHIPHSPDISDYAVEGTMESRQYFLLD